MKDQDIEQARLVGINHVALVVDDVDEALEWYGTLFDINLRGRTDTHAFIDMGDQFLALTESEQEDDPSDEHRHFGLVVDEPSAVARQLAELEADRLRTDGFDFRDPWGNRIQIVKYENVQFTKEKNVLAGMGLNALDKSPSAIEELAEKGMAPPRDDA